MSAVSIFNDVIGYVMCGPSCSHCAVAFRIGRLTIAWSNFDQAFRLTSHEDARLSPANQDRRQLRQLRTPAADVIAVRVAVNRERECL
jgi:hypothetical protein